MVIHSHCNLTGCDQTYVPWPSSHIPVIHHLVLLVQQLDPLILRVCDQHLPISQNTYACNTTFI
ncbi:hypothetical protein DPMN_033517 [Dreissena polymorpha]|uniref:Uncharacterized protein n=1 Tax=Dreissena polymorpha TaxID=45954 RepID=A0A9D4M3Y2_DREPO|nr:hypothetical protein DPMN_033517 [Dreissena polymorpha]